MDRQVGRLFGLENPADINAGQAVPVSQTAAIAHQSAGGGKLTKLEHCRRRLAPRQRGKPGTTADKEWSGRDHEAARVHSSQDRENWFEVCFAAPASRTCSSSPSERAAACASRDRAPALGLVGLTSSATSVAVGLSWCSNSIRFGKSSTLSVVTPVRLPPGRFRAATSPSWTGSSAVVKTMVIVPVAAFAASAEIWFAAITSA